MRIYNKHNSSLITSLVASYCDFISNNYKRDSAFAKRADGERS